MSAFAALKEDKTVYVWGNPDKGGNTGDVQGLTGVVSIFSTQTAFAALKEDKTVYVWGDPDQGGNQSQIPGLSNVTTIYSNYDVFIALSGASEPINVNGDTGPIGSTGTSYNIVKPIKNNSFSNLLNYLLYFPK